MARRQNEELPEVTAGMCLVLLCCSLDLRSPVQK